MTTIPQGQAAHDAWAALPEPVRAEAIRLAHTGQGHPDPAVAAVLVGVIRSQPWPWWRTALCIAGMSLFFGACVAVLLTAGSVEDRDLLTIGPLAVGFAAFLTAVKWMPKHSLPCRAEVANLRTFLTSPDAAVPPEQQPARRGLTRRRLAVSTAIALGTAAVAYAVVVLTGAPLRPGAGLRQAVGGAATVTILMLVLAYGRRWLRQRRGQREARTVAVTEQGLRFDRRPTIPWADVLGVTLDGPTSWRPDYEAALIWTLRDPVTITTPLHTLGTRPEELILAARAYLAAAKQAA